jgi:hypothetical protein
MEKILHQLIGGLYIPFIQRVSTIQGDAGFLPSTVHLKPVASFLFKWKNSFRTLEASR